MALDFGPCPFKCFESSISKSGFTVVVKKAFEEANVLGPLDKRFMLKLDESCQTSYKRLVERV